MPPPWSKSSAKAVSTGPSCAHLGLPTSRGPVNVPVTGLLLAPPPPPDPFAPLPPVRFAEVDGPAAPPQDTNPTASTRVRAITANPRNRSAALSFSCRPIEIIAMAIRHRAANVTLHKTRFLCAGKRRVDGG